MTKMFEKERLFGEKIEVTLRRLYWKEELSLPAIGKHLGLSVQTIYRWFKRLAIPTRTASEAQKIHLRKHGHPKGMWGKHHSADTKERWSEQRKGKGNPMFGRRRPDLAALNVSRHNIPLSPEHRAKIIANHPRGNNHPFYGRKRPDFAKRYGRKDEFEAKRLKAVCQKPTTPERKLMGILRKHRLPYRYVGDGSVIIGGRNPDFINTNGVKQVIEVFGFYFHSPLINSHVDWKRTYTQTIKHYREHGFNCLIFWDDELANEQLVLSKRNGIVKMEC